MISDSRVAGFSNHPLALLMLSLNSGQLGSQLKMHRAAPHPAALGKVGLKECFRTLRESD